MQPGQLILNNEYKVIDLAGRGAFGEVYRCLNIALNVERAIKLLRADAPGVGSTMIKTYLDRFQLEAQLGARLEAGNAQHVIKVYDFRQTEEKTR